MYMEILLVKKQDPYYLGYETGTYIQHEWICIYLSTYESCYKFKILYLVSDIMIPQVVVFFSTCDAVDFHYSLLSEFQFSSHSQAEGTRQKFLGCKIFRLHGNMVQEDRRTSFQTFKTEKSALLLTSDVSARGLDIPKVRCIIQYDSPGEATEYVHRYLPIFTVDFLLFDLFVGRWMRSVSFVNDLFFFLVHIVLYILACFNMFMWLVILFEIVFNKHDQ